LNPDPDPELVVGVVEVEPSLEELVWVELPPEVLELLLDGKPFLLITPPNPAGTSGLGLLKAEAAALA